MTEQSSAGWHVLPPVYFLAALIAMAYLHYELPGAQIVGTPLRYAGVGLIVAGLGLVSWAALLFHRAGTAIRPFQVSSALVAEGPYRVTRNPMYLAMTVILLGTAILLGSATPFVVVPVFAVLIQWRFIRMEEGALEAKFGQAYRDYKAGVRRWL